jgi:hypothetical protein
MGMKMNNGNGEKVKNRGTGKSQKPGNGEKFNLKIFSDFHIPAYFLHCLYFTFLQIVSEKHQSIDPQTEVQANC